MLIIQTKLNDQVLYVDNVNMTASSYDFPRINKTFFHSAMNNQLLWQIETQRKDEIFLTDYRMRNESPEVKMMSIIILGSTAQRKILCCSPQCSFFIIILGYNVSVQTWS